MRARHTALAVHSVSCIAGPPDVSSTNTQSNGVGGSGADTATS